MKVVDWQDSGYSNNSMSACWRKYTPRSCEYLMSEHSLLFFLRENTNGRECFYTLDRLAMLARNKRGMTQIGHRKVRIQKQDAEQMARDLRQQAQKLEELARTYELLSTALSLSAEDIEDVMLSDSITRKQLDNPF